MNLVDRLIVGALPLVPKPIVHRIANRYIAGPTLSDAVRVVRQLNAEGAMGTIDVLGEDFFDQAAAEAGMREYLLVLGAIKAENLDGNISVKLSSLGLRFDAELCYRLMREVVRTAAAQDCFVRIDMEDSSVTDVTLRVYERLVAEFPHVGVVLQACLRRTLDDAHRLVRTKTNVRLCKGIYREARVISYRDRDIIRRNYVAILEAILRGGSYAGIATHDEYLTAEAIRVVRELGLSPAQYEFQMLLGIDEELRRILLAAGHRVRVYVPFGAQWYAYSTRRLKENPQIAGYVAKAMFSS